MSHTNNRSTAAHNESKNADNKQQVKNRKQSGKSAAPHQPAPGTPVPAKLEELEARLADYTKSLSEAKKQSQKVAENLAKARDLVSNERYCVAVHRHNIGKADEEDIAIISSRKAAENAETGIAKAMAMMPKDTDDVSKARDLAKSEDGSLTSAIAETIHNWTKCYSTLYASIGITNKKQLTPALLKGLCPFLMVATADGLKAATITRTAVRKNGKAVKKDGKRVYKYTLRERTRWSAYGLYETLERNYWFSKAEGAAFTDDELKARMSLLDAEVAALAALKAAKEAKMSEVAEKAAEAAQAEVALKDAAKAAADNIKAQLNEVETTAIKPRTRGRHAA